MARPKRFLLRIFAVVIVLYSFLFVLEQYKEIKSVGDRLKLQLGVKVKLQKWYSNFLHNEYDFDFDPRFNQRIQEVLQLKRDDPDLWPLIKDPHNLPLSINVPEYFRKDVPKPILQPFDPRLTLPVYFERIAKHKNTPVEFHWLDWVDLSKLEKFIFNTGEKNKCENLFDISKDQDLVQDSEIKQTKEFCVNHLDTKLGYKITQNPGQQTIENNELIGKLYLYTSMEPPTKLVIVSNGANIDVPVKNRENNVKYGLLHNGYVESVKQKQLDITKSYNHMVSQVPTKKTTPPPMIKLTSSQFLFNAKAKVRELEKKKKLTLNEKLYLQSLKFSLAEDDPPKFFQEARLVNSYKEKWLGEHYDWRFFNGLTVGKSEQMISLCKLIKTYLEFCINEGLVTWIAHGSLLSWYWNGLIFPWDTDLDVQMPIVELNKLAERFNQSMVIEKLVKNGEFNGMSKYFIDISSSITHRERGNGLNNIDGRFIDVDTGLYVDITGLSITNTKAPTRFEYLMPEYADISGQEAFNKNSEFGLVNCRNNHFLKVDEIDTLKPIHFQDQMSYLLTNFLIMINNEYSLDSMTEKNYRDFIYLKNFRIWANTQNLLDYLNQPAEWIAKYKGEEDNVHSDKRVIGTLEKIQINKLAYDDYLSLLYDKNILKDYLINRNNSRNHQEEIDRLLYNKDTKQWAEGNQFLSNDFTMDLFLNKVFETGWDYDSEVKRMESLSAM